MDFFYIDEFVFLKQETDVTYTETLQSPYFAYTH